MTSSARFQPQITGRHVFVALIAFFGVMLLANGAFVYFAISSFNGEETKDAYRRGLAYNARIAEDRELAGRRWQTSLSLQDSGVVSLKVRDRDDGAVPGLAVTVWLGRPATDRFDHGFELHETAPGIYEAKAARMSDGNWIGVVEGRRERSTGSDVVLRLKERLWLPPNN